MTCNVLDVRLTLTFCHSSVVKGPLIRQTKTDTPQGAGRDATPRLSIPDRFARLLLVQVLSLHNGRQSTLPLKGITTILPHSITLGKSTNHFGQFIALP